MRRSNVVVREFQKVLIEHDRPRRQAIQIRRLDPFMPIAAETAAAQTIKGEHNGARHAVNGFVAFQCEQSTTPFIPPTVANERFGGLTPTPTAWAPTPLALGSNISLTTARGIAVFLEVGLTFAE